MITSNRQYTGGMARPKKFARRVLVALPEKTIGDIHVVKSEKEDRSDFIRAAVETEVAIRKLDVYEDLRGHLMANETIQEFCAKAVKRAVLQRKAALAEPGIDAPEPGGDD